jgi:hypothetical protein
MKYLDKARCPELTIMMEQSLDEIEANGSTATSLNFDKPKA